MSIGKTYVVPKKQRNYFQNGTKFGYLAFSCVTYSLVVGPIMECKNLSNTPKDPCVKCDPNYIFFVKIDEHTQSFGLTKGLSKCYDLPLKRGRETLAFNDFRWFM